MKMMKAGLVKTGSSTLMNPLRHGSYGMAFSFYKASVQRQALDIAVQNHTL
jgi:hypothetical protein